MLFDWFKKIEKKKEKIEEQEKIVETNEKIDEWEKEEIPEDLKNELREARRRIELRSSIRYSLSPSREIIDTAVKEIKETELEPSFRDVLFDFIDKKGIGDPDVYKKAKVDKRLFSKIRIDAGRAISRNTAIRLGLALELSQEDFDILLNANHTSLSDNNYFDIAIKWCIKNKIYDIEQVNDILYACDLDLLTKD